MHSAARIAVAWALLFTAACDSSPPTAGNPLPDVAGAATLTGELAFAPNAHPFGQSLTDWNKAWWRWELSVPTDRNPSLDPTGANCAEGQGGKVWFLGSLFASGEVTRACTIPDHRALLVNLSSLLNDYPCPDPSFRPAPGQSLEEFLAEGARAVEDGVNGLTLSVDGRDVTDLFERRYPTGLFDFTGDPSLRTSIDGCITGSSQVAVSDGFFVLLRPLHPGEHTVVFTAASVNGVHTSVTYQLTVLDSGGGDD
jgi:hypothetical protein